MGKSVRGAASEPIGIIDSGLGGLSVLQAVKAQLPHHDLFYLADRLWCPYGERTPAAIRERMRKLTDGMLDLGVKTVVLACNSATIAAIDDLRQRYSVPFIGVEPGLKPAIELTRTGVVGVLATQLSLQGERFEQLVERYAPGVSLVKWACPEWVRLVEQGEHASTSAQAAVEAIAADMLNANADVVILGCTHYLFFKALLQQALGQSVTIIDTGPAVAKQVARCAGAAGIGAVHLYTTDDPAGVPDVDKLLGLQGVGWQAWTTARLSTFLL